MKASHPTRILTCCYCGARSTLAAGRRAALVCHGCGAPISRIEELQPAIERLPRRPAQAKPAIPHPADRHGGHKPHDRPARRRKGKRRKGGFWYGLRRLADRADDLFDLDDLLDFD
jgi:hypothetical protein